jgi:hypothetical protein
LPGGGDNPVALIQIPRERMTGTGVAASLAHETGHQAAALLGLVESLRPRLDAIARRVPDAWTWRLWSRWISEVLADLWALARLGPTATAGLIGVMSLPRYFVFRISTDDPHPPPWLRVRLSIALGDALYPDAQWTEMAALWGELYPSHELTAAQQTAFARLSASIPLLVRVLLEHRLDGERLGDMIGDSTRSPARLRAAIAQRDWRARITAMPPSLALAVLGQARWMRSLSPRDEARIVAALLGRWALRRALGSRPATCDRN